MDHSATVARAATLLRETFGFDDFRPGQEGVIEALLSGRSALAVFPTGAGKSLCYQLPALLLDGITLVVSPLIALMKDQVDALRARGVAAARLDSSLEAGEARRVEQEAGAGKLRLLYVAPERLANERFLRWLGELRIALLAVDEAHCISEWGHNFRPDYLKLAGFARERSVERVLALTATATPSVSQDICRAFGIAPADHIQTGFHRPNLELRVTPCAGEERRRVLLERLESSEGPAIVYVTLQRQAEELAAWLSERGVNAAAYHAGLPADRRASVQEAFMRDERRVVVATIAFGMGIDKADIRAIYHANLPKTLENYAQEVGRAGRDGLPARCELLASADDTTTLENFVYGDTPDPEALEALCRELLGQEEQFSISRYDLAARHDIRPLVVATALTYLELEGVLTATGPFYTTYRMQPCGELGAVIAGFDDERADFLRRLFACASEGRSWLTLDLAEAAAALGEPRARLVAAVGFLEQRGDLLVKPSGLQHGYRKGRAPEDPEELIAKLKERFRERERRDIERLERVLAYAREPTCLTRHLVGYFGEELEEERCGHCQSCTSPPPAPRALPRAAAPDPGEQEARQIRDVCAEEHPALASPRSLARFLCGITSPAASRARLSRHPAFGALAAHPFPRVLALAEDTLSAESPTSPA